MSSMLKKYLARVSWKDTAIMITIGLILFFVIKLMFGGIFGISLVVIENGYCPYESSMCPTYDKGDLFILVKDNPEDIKMGDVIVYESHRFSSQGMLIIHRVVNITIIEDSNGEHYYYRVSGDNLYRNNHIDWYNDTSTLIPFEDVQGKTTFMIPKIGHVRLWLTENPGLRYLVIGFLAIIAIYLLFAPDKKKGEEESEETKSDTIEATKESKKFSLSKDSIKLFFITQWKAFLASSKSLFTDKRKRIKLIIAVSSILLIIILVPVIDSLLKSPNISTVRIYNLEVGKINEGYLSSEEIIFLPFEIYIQHDGSWNKVLKAFEAEGIQEGNVIASMTWNSYYQKEGNFNISGSFVFPTSLFDKTKNLTISISYQVHLRFGQDYPVATYEQIFTPLEFTFT